MRLHFSVYQFVTNYNIQGLNEVHLLQNPKFPYQLLYRTKFHIPLLDELGAMVEQAQAAQRLTNAAQAATTPSVGHPSQTKLIPLLMTLIHTSTAAHDEQEHKGQVLAPPMHTVIYHQPPATLHSLPRIRTAPVVV